MRGQCTNALQINGLGRRCQAGSPHIFDHLRTQRCHHGIPCFEHRGRDQFPALEAIPVIDPSCDGATANTAKPFSRTSFMLHQQSSVPVSAGSAFLPGARPESGRFRSPHGANGSTAEELAQNAAAIGPEHQRHAGQRAAGHHTRRYRQGELFGELRIPSLK
jgi:hypothetical protein